MKDTAFYTFIDELRRKSDIVEIARGYVDLRRKGSQFWACCPFHHEKTPSFTVNEQKQIYKCFGCGESGDVIKFVMAMENCDFMTAVRQLAERAHMEVPEFGKRDDDEVRRMKKFADRTYALLREAGLYYVGELRKSPAVKDSLIGEGISAEVIKSYGAGYSPSEYGVIKHLRGAGYYDNEIVGAGLCEQREGRLYDVNAGKPVLPVINSYNKIVAFVGVDGGKYTVTRDNAVFKRERELYGIHTLKQIKIDEGLKFLALTLSPSDALWLASHGVRNAVAVMGGGVTGDQARVLRRYTDNFVVFFNGVADGLDKRYSGLEPLTTLGLGVKVAGLVQRDGAASLGRKYGAERVVAAVNGARSLLEYQLRKLAERYELGTDRGRIDYADEALSYLALLDNPVKTESYFGIISALTSLSADWLRRRLRKEDVAETADRALNIAGEREGAYFAAVRSVMSLAYRGYSLPDDVEEYLTDSDKAAFAAVRDGSGKPSDFYTEKETERITSVNITEENAERFASDSCSSLRKEYKKLRVAELSRLIDEEADPNKKRELMHKLREYLA